MLEAAELQRRRRRRHLLTKAHELRYTPGTEFDMSMMQQKSDSVSSCTPSVLCDSEWDLINDSVLDIYAVNVQLGVMALCTGASACLSVFFPTNYITAPAVSGARLLSAGFSFIPPNGASKCRTIHAYDPPLWMWSWLCVLFVA